MSWDDAVEVSFDKYPDPKGNIQIRKRLVLQVGCLFRQDYANIDGDMELLMGDIDKTIIRDGMKLFMERDYDFVRWLFHDEEYERK